MPLFLILLFLGLLIRFLFIGSPGFVADIAFWKSWSLATVDQGIVAASHSTNTNYPPGFLYVLWFMGKFYSLFGDPHNYNDYWRENNFLFLFVCKSIAIAADIGITYLIYWFAKKCHSERSEESRRNHNQRTGSLTAQAGFTPLRCAQDDKKNARLQQTPYTKLVPLILAAAFYLNPVVIIDSAVWGQVESFGMLFTIIAILLLFYKKPLWAAAVFTIGTQMKLQNIIYIPLFFFFIFRAYDWRTMIKSIAAAAATFFLINIPFLLAKDMNHVLYLLTVNNDYFPWMSLNAHNLWWIVSGAHGMTTIDKIPAIGITTAKTVGLILFSSSYLLAIILLWKKPSLRNFLLGLTFVIFAFFLLTTQSHERYCYPVVVLMLFLYPLLEKENPKSEIRSSKQIQIENKNSKMFRKFGSLNLEFVSNFVLRYSDFYFWFLYGLLTAAIFFNVHWGLAANYPQYGWDLLMAMSTPLTTTLNSYLLIVLFLCLLPYFFTDISLRYLTLCLGLIPLGIFATNLSFILGYSLPLIKLKPILTRQDYGVLQVNQSVNSAEGWKKWTRLSNNYFYYRSGFGTHATSRLEFALNNHFSRLETDTGIDTEAGTNASVVFQIYGDGRLLYESGKQGRFDFPQHISVPVAGVQTLALVVTDSGDGIGNDHADWLNPILYK